MNILMPQLGETVSEGTIAVWHVKVGDKVGKYDALLDVETDKAAVEVPAQVDGVITSINVDAGETVDVGHVLCVIEVEGGEPEVEEAAPPPAAAEPVQEEVKPASAPEQAAPMQAAPAVRRLAAEHSLDLNDIPATGKKGRTTREDVLAYLENSGAGAAGSSAAASDSTRMLSPVVRRLVAENNLDLNAITATGKNGRTTRQDVLAYIENGGVAKASSGRSTPVPTPGALDGRAVIPFDRIRKLTADHMVMSKATSPHVLQAVEVEYTAVDAIRSKMNPTWKPEKGYSLTYLPFIAKALCLAIKEFPKVNASVENESLRVHSLINMAIAVDLNFEGLVAPVVKDCGSLSVARIAESIRALSQKARTGSLSPDDLSGGTYTISNSGPFGTLLTAPIINQPQVAIISTDGIRKRPVVVETEHGDSIAIRPVGILAQSFDHRAIDGAYSAAFLNRVRDIIENHDWAREF